MVLVASDFAPSPTPAGEGISRLAKVSLARSQTHLPNSTSSPSITPLNLTQISHTHQMRLLVIQLFLFLAALAHADKDAIALDSEATVVVLAKAASESMSALSRGHLIIRN